MSLARVVIVFDVVTVAVNGAGVSGLAGRTRDERISRGYGKARVLRTAPPSSRRRRPTILTDSSARQNVALDLELDLSRIQPVFGSPEFGYLQGDQVSVYICLDRS